MKPIAVIGWSLLIIIVAGAFFSLFDDTSSTNPTSKTDLSEKQVVNTAEISDQFSPITLSGIGNQISDKYYFEKGFYIVDYSNSGDHMSVVLRDEDGKIKM